MNLLPSENLFDSLYEWIMSDPHDVQQYVAKMRSQHPQFSPRQLSQQIIDDQSLQSALWGAATSFGNLLTLPLMIPLDLIRSWKIQDFTIRCIAEVYGYTPQKTDLRMAIVLLLSNGSMDELKQFVMVEATQAVNQYALTSLDAMKHSALQMAAQEGSRYAAKVVTKNGKKLIASLGMKEFSKAISEIIAKVAGKKFTQKSLEKLFGAVVPVFGAAIGGGIDWLATQAVGKLAIEYFENAMPEYIESVLANSVRQGLVEG